MEEPYCKDGTSQTESNGAEDGTAAEDTCSGLEGRPKFSRVRATFVETISRRKQDRLAVSRRVALSRAMSAFLVASTTASCLLLQRGGLVNLALGRIGVAIVGTLWFVSTFTEAFLRDTRRACDGLSLLCFVFWACSHFLWRLFSSEAGNTRSGGTGGSDIDRGDGAAALAWVWVDLGMAWVLAPAAGGSLQLSLWGSIVPSWLCVTGALAFGLRAEEVAEDGEAVEDALVLFAALAVSALAALAVGYQTLWEHARDTGNLIALEDSIAAEDHKRRQASFSELLLRHLVTDPSLQVLRAGVKELFKDTRIFVMHSDALEQIQDGVDLLVDYGEKALEGLKNGGSELPTPILEQTDMEEMLDACLRTTAYLAVSRDHHKVQLDMKVAADVNKNVRTYRLWLSQMTRACLIHALHPDEDDSVILRVSYTRTGWMRVGVEAVWRVAGRTKGGGGGDEVAQPPQEERRTLSGWDRDMPAAAWWVRAAALALGGEADYDRSKDREGFHELWFTIPAENIPDDEVETPPAAARGAGAGIVRQRRAPAAAAVAFFDDDDEEGDDRTGKIPVTEASGAGEGGISGEATTWGQPWQAGGGPRTPTTTAATTAAAAAAGVERAARRESRRESLRTMGLAPSTAGPVGGGAGAGGGALPRPGGWAASALPVPSSAPSHALPAVKPRGSLLPAVCGTSKAAPESSGEGDGDGGGQTSTQVTKFVGEDATAKEGLRSGIAGNGLPVLGRGYRSTIGGTLVGGGGNRVEDGGGRNNGSKRMSNESMRLSVPAPGSIRVSRVDSDDGDGDGDDAVGGRSSSAPGPRPQKSGTSGLQSFFPSPTADISVGGGESGSRSSGTAGTGPTDRLSQSLPGSPKRWGSRGSSLSGTVKKLLGTADGLSKLRASLQDDDDPEGAAAAAMAVQVAMGNTVAMRKGEAVARAAGQGAAGLVAATLARRLAPKRPSSAPNRAEISKKASVFGGLVQTLVESNGMTWVRTGRLGSARPTECEASDDTDSDNTEPKLEILLVDPQGLVRWVLPRLNERNFSVTVAHSAEEAMEMIQEGFFQVAVVDLHMPRMVGTDFCRRVRAHELKTTAAIRAASVAAGRVGGGGDEEDEGGEEQAIKLLLHTTSAGSIKLDELEEFLEEGLVEEYVPHPLDIATLFDFLKLFEEEDDQYGTRKMSSMLEHTELGGGGTNSTASSKLVKALTPTRLSIKANKLSSIGRGIDPVGAADPPAGLLGRLFGPSRAPPPPSAGDVASTFFNVKGRSPEAHAAAVRHPAAKGVRGVEGSTSKVAGPWRPGAATVSPGLGLAGEGGR